MPTTRVTRNYQITIPSEIRKKIEVRAGDTLIIEYLEEEAAVKIKFPHRGPRITRRLGRSLTPEDIQSSIEKGMSERRRS